MPFQLGHALRALRLVDVLEDEAARLLVDRAGVRIGQALIEYLADLLLHPGSGVGAFAPVNSGERALDLDAALAPDRLDAVAAHAAVLRGEDIGHTAIALRSVPV